MGDASAFHIERGITRIRLAGLVFLTGFLALFRQEFVIHLPLALLALAFGWAFVLLLLAREPYRGTTRLVNAATLISDGVFIVAWIASTGGFESPFFPVMYVAVIAAMLLVGSTGALVAAFTHATAYATLAWGLGQLDGNAVALASRIAFLFFVAGATIVFAREIDAQARERAMLRERVAAARDAEARFRGLLDSAPDAILIVDRAGAIAFANSRTEALFGRPREAILGARAEEILAMPTRGVLDVDAGGGIAEGSAQLPEGNVRPVEVSARPHDTPEGRVLTAVVRDVTERKRADAERQANAQRERELARLREMNQLKAQIINTAAHELGTPLTPLKLHLHLLKASRGKLNDTERRSLDVLDRNVERLVHLVQDILDVARIEGKRLAVNRQPSDLNRIVVEAGESFAEPARQAGIELESRLTPDLVVFSDAKRLSQVMFNLLSNAIKFTPPGGRVVVDTKREEGAAVVRVSDTGAGLTEGQISRLFQPFGQVHDTMEKTRSGTGLGLYISRGIVEQHGGRIWAASAGPAQGAEFTFAIPLGDTVLGPPREAAEPRQKSAMERRARDLV